MAERVRRCLEYVPADKLFLTTDCGLRYVHRTLARAKITNLVAGVRQVRGELAGMTGVSPTELLEVAVAAARAGGTVLVEGLERPKEVEHKTERTSIVTWADITAQAAIVQLIADRYPDHAILAEEGGAAGARRGRATRGSIDPLDGTSNYAHGIPFACTSVAVRDADGLVAGAIFEPFRGELFTVRPGRGGLARR